MLRAGLVIGSAVALAALGWWTQTGTSSVAAEPPAPAPIAAPEAASAASPVARKRANAEVDDPVAFPPLGTPRAGDWRAAHPEEHQTFEAWRTGRRRVVTEERNTLGVLALDDVSRFGVTTGLLTEHLSAYYGLPARAAPAKGVPSFPTRDRGVWKQTKTEDVLRWLEGEVASDTYCLLAVTSRDLYPDDAWNFVFGEASLAQRVGVFSFARMHPAFPAPPPPESMTAADRLLVARRCLKVVTHEVGHMFGIEHCVERRCLMNGVNHVPEMDASPLHLCPACLRKVVHATKVDVIERYRGLAALYRINGLVPEADFVDGRIATLTR